MNAHRQPSFDLPLIDLPEWADCLLGRSILSAILLDPPHSSIGDAMGFKVQWYVGKPARQLRDLFDDRLGALSDAIHDAYHAGRGFDELSAQEDALLRSERPDALITRLLAEPMSLAPVFQIAPGQVAA